MKEMGEVRGKKEKTLETLSLSFRFTSPRVLQTLVVAHPTSWRMLHVFNKTRVSMI
jgi:hypothetical protein